MYGNYSYPINGNVQQNLAQQRMNNLQNQYNQMFPQQEMMQQQVPHKCSNRRWNVYGICL